MKELIMNEDNFLGRYYTFFLGNKNLGDAHYTYQLYSPGMSDKYVPYFSLTKVSERTFGFIPRGKNSDILNFCIGDALKGENKSLKYASYVSDLVKKDSGIVVERDQREFPEIELKKDEEKNSLQKNLIINLRDSLRWRSYRYYNGRLIDVLWTKTEYAVFKFCSDNEKIWLEAQGLYENTDPLMTRPCEGVDLEKLKIDAFSFKKSEFNVGEANKIIKRTEWFSFDR